MTWHRRDFWPVLIWVVVFAFMVSCSSGGDAEVQEEDFAMSDEVPMPEPLPPPPTNPNFPPPRPPEQQRLNASYDGMSETMWNCRSHLGLRREFLWWLVALLLEEELGYASSTYDYR